MWDDDCIRFVVRCCEENGDFALPSLRNLDDLRDAVEELCAEGEAIHNSGIVPDDVVKQKKEALFQQHPTEERSDPAKVIALLFFHLGLEHRRTATQANPRLFPVNPVRRLTLATAAGSQEAVAKMLAVGEPDRRCRVDNSADLDGSTRSRLFPRAAAVLNEEYFSTELARAQQARWKCRYDEVLLGLARLRKHLAGVDSTVSNYWKAKLLDLQVEVSFTVSQEPYSSLALGQTETAIRRWGGLHDPIALTHAYLRRSVVYRQMFTESQSKCRQVDSHIHDSLLTLYAAQEEILPDVKRSRILDSRNAEFGLYNDLAKALSHARQFDLAKGYLKQAQAVCDGLEERAPRRSLDLLITRAIFIRECFIDKRIFSHVGELDALAEAINNGLNHRLEFEDVVLRELLRKSYIPVLVSMGKREEAEEVLRRCELHAQQHRLHNQQRDLSYLARALELRC